MGKESKEFKEFLGDMPGLSKKKQCDENCNCSENFDAPQSIGQLWKLLKRTIDCVNAMQDQIRVIQTESDTSSNLHWGALAVAGNGIINSVQLLEKAILGRLWEIGKRNLKMNKGIRK